MSQTRRDRQIGKSRSQCGIRGEKVHLIVRNKHIKFTQLLCALIFEIHYLKQNRKILLAGIEIARYSGRYFLWKNVRNKILLFFFLSSEQVLNFYYV